MSGRKEPINIIPILRSRKLKLKTQPEELEMPEIDKDKPDNGALLSLHLQSWLDSMMINTKIKDMLFRN